MEYKDYYKVLGISRSANQDEIKRTYRKLARKYHPDVSKEKNAEQRFKEVGEAYEVLKDPEKRAAYDQLGTGWRAGDEFRPPPGWNPGFNGGGFNGSAQFDFSDFFESLFGDAGQSPRHTRRSPFRTTGEDQHAKIAITLEEAYQGTTRRLELQIPEQNSNGKVYTKNRTLNVKIPQGVIHGQKIRLSGQGSTGMNNTSRGDLYLKIEFKPHRFYRIEGKDIYLTLPITPWEAALGSTIAVPTLGGKVELKIPVDSESGQKLRLKGRGFPGGDQYIMLQMVTPSANTEASQAFYQKMAQELPLNPRANIFE
ncbi:DnaJ C-terminal domain-containing protein [Candidatus Parabeggiatoa sp. HSG14]|uniref:DnaJ C-terminal domain-containing protein n=1 Tax=Candidatus Parabeggiatoa sp. HSG14 TaxID=3055593 RepID=UPI0025A74D3B|nr:DnaJ C-terminal domain-containing protein [Thiotrichales bacterium HSG14]